MHNLIQTRNTHEELLRRQISIRLDPGGQPSTLDDAARSVRVVAATEQPVRMFDPESWEYIDEILLMGRMREPENGQTPLLDTHNRWTTDAMLGSARDWAIEGDELMSTAIFSGIDRGDEAFSLVREGHLTDVSVGYQVFKRQRIAEGETAEVDGRTFEGPLLLALDWQPKELSFCPIGADDKAKTRAVDGTPDNPNLQEATMEWWERMRKHLMLSDNASKDEVLAQLRSRLNLGEAADEDQIRMAMEERAFAEPEPPAGGGGGNMVQDGDDGQRSGDEIQTAIETERQRTSEIRNLCRAHGFEDEADGLIANGSSMDQARTHILAKVEARSSAQNTGNFQIEFGLDERDKFRSAGTDAVLLRGGAVVENAAAGAVDLRGFMLREMARECLRVAGQAIPSDPREMVGRALTASDLPYILDSAAQRQLLVGFESAEETYEIWVDTTGQVQDFRQIDLVGMSEADDLEEIKPEGEYKYGSFDELAEAVKIATYGKLYRISREAIINDDLGVIIDTPKIMGEAAARKLGDIAYAALTANPNMGDGGVLFSATKHKNLGTAGVVATGTLNEGFKLMGTQKDIKGKRSLNIVPSYFLGPKSIMGSAEQFFSTDTIGGEANQPNLTNIYHGDRLVRVYDSRLDDVSETAWYLAGRKGKTVKMFFLNGVKEPFQESKNGWQRDGVEHKIRLDAAAVPVSWKALFKNAG